jgi:hypothetical protein
MWREIGQSGRGAVVVAGRRPVDGGLSPSGVGGAISSRSPRDAGGLTDPARPRRSQHFVRLEAILALVWMAVRCRWQWQRTLCTYPPLLLFVKAKLFSLP